MREDQERCLATGMNGFVAKPFRLEELQAVPGKFVVFNKPFS